MTLQRILDFDILTCLCFKEFESYKDFMMDLKLSFLFNSPEVVLICNFPIP